MSGICGTANWGGNADLERMNATQRHRGPDDCGVWQHLAPDGSRFALGSSRLSIIDLSLAGDGWRFAECRSWFPGASYAG